MLQQAVDFVGPMVMAEDLFVHIFVRMQDAESIYLCGAKTEAVTASVAIEWAYVFTNMMCPECLRLYNAQRHCPDTPEAMRYGPHL